MVRLFSSPEEYRRVLQQVDRTGQFSGELSLVGRDGAAHPNQITVTPFETGGCPSGTLPYRLT